MQHDKTCMYLWGLQLCGRVVRTLTVLIQLALDTVVMWKPELCIALDNGGNSGQKMSTGSLDVKACNKKSQSENLLQYPS